jgi:hypothetical protein
VRLATPVLEAVSLIKFLNFNVIFLDRNQQKSAAKQYFTNQKKAAKKNSNQSLKERWSEIT